MEIENAKIFYEKERGLHNLILVEHKSCFVCVRLHNAFYCLVMEITAVYITRKQMTTNIKKDH